MVINTVAHQAYSILYAFSNTELESREVSSSPVVLVRSICLLLLLLATSNMGRTRSGREIVYTEASYGRAARAEAVRKRKKRKLASTSSVRTDNSSVVIVGGTRTTTKHHATDKRSDSAGSKFRHSTQCLHSSWSYPAK
jgi:hypothetical protein